MARMPGAAWRPLGTQTEPRLTRRNKVILHTMVGSLSGTDSYFRRDGYGGTESHFGVGGDGTVYQWQDTDWQADANLEGNDDCISIETADHGPEFPSWSGSNVPAWTTKQIEAIARILAWCHETHGIPLSLIPDTADSTRGVGYHRQGIEPWRKHGELYSQSYGKVCPGDRRVAQIPTVIARAKQIVTGDDDMPLDNADLDKIEQRFLRALRTPVEWVAPSVADMAAKRNWGNLSLAEKVEHTLRHANVLRDALDPTQDLMRQILTEAASDPDVDVALTPEQIDALGAASAKHLLARIGATDAPA